MIMQKERELLVLDSKKSNMTLRILSAMAIGPLFIIAILFFKPLFYLLMILVALAMGYEWYQMTKSSLNHILLGFIIIPIPIISLLIIASEEQNRWLLLLYFVTMWSVDSFAMFGGKNIGGLKLAPKISPNKTYSGLIVGIFGAGLMVFLLSLLPWVNLSNYSINNTQLIIASILLALIAQMSDLFISYFKRKFAIKDSGNIIPGHGGVLDRFDSIIITAPILLFIIKML